MEVVLACTLFLLIWTASLLALLIILYSSLDCSRKPKIPHEKLENPLGSLNTTVSVPFKFRDLDKKEGKNKVFGIFLSFKPTVEDPEVIKHVLVKHCSSCCDDEMYIDETRDPLFSQLIALESDSWEELRNKLSPAFAARRMKLVFATVLKFGEQLIDRFPNNLSADFEGFKLTVLKILAEESLTVSGIESNIIDDNSISKEIALKLNHPFRAELLKSLLADHFGLVKLLYLSSKDYYLKLNVFIIRNKTDIKLNDFLQTLIEQTD